MASILLSSKPPSLLLHLNLRPNPSPRPRPSLLLPPLSTSFPLNPPSFAVSLSLRSSVNRPRHSVAVAVSARLIPSLPPPPPPPPQSPSPLQSTIIRITTTALSFIRSLIQSVSATARRFLNKLPPGSLRWAKRVLMFGLIIYELLLFMRHAFPMLPWHRQPLTAVAQLCDPFLALSRRVIPPLFGSSDLSERLGIQLLSTLDLVLLYAWRR